MKKSWCIKARLSNLFILALLVCFDQRVLSAAGVQFHVSPYFDSNVQEALADPEPTFGLKLRGNLNRETSGPRWNLYGNVLSLTFLDAKYPSESKLVGHIESGFRYRLLSRLSFTGHLIYFQKAFYWQRRSYRWTEGNSYVQWSPIRRFTFWAGYAHKSTAFKFRETIRYYEDSFEIRVLRLFARRFSIEGEAAFGTVDYRDYTAWTVEDDSNLVSLHIDQEDEFVRGLVHIRYQGRVITGVQGGYESASSNSVVGEYDQIVFRIYISGRLGNSIFYHFVLQRVDKHYRYPELQGITGFRDPEERIQNRTHARLERELGTGVLGFFQMSFLENETILNQRYYDKTVLELGVKYTF